MEIIKLLLPVLTFVAGFLLNFVIERRRRENALVENSARILVGLASDWQAALSDLVTTCLESKTFDEVQRALRKYERQRDISTRLDFELAILAKHKKAQATIKAVGKLLAWQAGRHSSDGVKWLFQGLDSILTHKIADPAHFIFMRLPPTLEGDDRFERRRQVAFEQLKLILSEFYGAYNEALGAVIATASVLVQPGTK